MTNDTAAIEDLAEEIQRLVQAQPHLENMLKAFGPLLLEKQLWLSDTSVDRRSQPIDAQRFGQGVPLNRQQQLFFLDDPWGSGGWSVAKAISQGFPHLAGDMEVLLRLFTDGKYDCFSLFFANSRETDGQLVDKAAELGISSLALHLFLRVLNRFMLSKKARDLQAELAEIPWKKGYCPVCGGFPHLAILGDEGQRKLHCADCGHAWGFARLTCPYCDHEDPQNTNVFFIDGQQESSAFTCDKCRRYLLTTVRSAKFGRHYPDLIAMALIHLDIILQEKGFLPMAECEWNGFDALSES